MTEEEIKQMQTDLAEAQRVAKEASDSNAALADSVAKLEANNAALVGEKKEALTAAEQATKDALEKSGSLDEIKEFYAKQNAENKAEYDSKLKDLRNAGDARDIAEAKAKHIGDFADSNVANALLGGMITKDDDGIKYRGFDGEIVAENAEGFTKWFNESESTASVRRGSQANGGGATGGLPGGSANSGKGDFNGNSKEKVNAAVRAVPAIASLPLK